MHSLVGMGTNKINLILVLVLSTLIVNCGSKHTLIQEGQFILPSSNALAAQTFETSVYPILQTNCYKCHGTTQQPKFAVANPIDSQNALIQYGLVNIDTPDQSRIYLKVKSGHQGFSLTLANNLLSAVTVWAVELKKSPGSITDLQPPVLEPTFQSIHNLILVPKCLGCHSSTSERKEDYSTYESTISTGKVVPGDASESEMYKECANGSMPDKSPPLTTEELEAMRTWINNGALNN